MTYLSSEFCETQTARGMTENSGADVRATNAMFWRQNSVSKH